MLLAVSGLILAVGLSGTGCSALNPSAVQVLFPEPIASELTSATIDSPSGYVPILLINNTTFSQTVLAYLENQGVDITDPNLLPLRPRIRFRVSTLFSSGAISTVEFIEGSSLFQSTLVVQDAQGQDVTLEAFPPPDLLENTLNNSVAVCDVAAVRYEVVPTDTQSSIEMFVPTFLKEITLTEATQPLGGVVVIRELSQRFDPQFRPLLVDTVDEDGTIQVFRNFGIREVPGFPTSLTCGSVVVWELSGELSLPFVEDERGEIVPGFLDTDAPAQAGIPGRFRLTVSVR